MIEPTPVPYRKAADIADQVVPAYRNGRRSYRCTSHTAKRWQAAYDAAVLMGAS